MAFTISSIKIELENKKTEEHSLFERDCWLYFEKKTKIPSRQALTVSRKQIRYKRGAKDTTSNTMECYSYPEMVITLCVSNLGVFINMSIKQKQ